jgi:hypothetical protein
MNKFAHTYIWGAEAADTMRAVIAKDFFFRCAEERQTAQSESLNAFTLVSQAVDLPGCRN